MTGHAGHTKAGVLEIDMRVRRGQAPVGGMTAQTDIDLFPILSFIEGFSRLLQQVGQGFGMFRPAPIAELLMAVFAQTIAPPELTLGVGLRLGRGEIGALDVLARAKIRGEIELLASPHLSLSRGATNMTLGTE